MPFDTYFAGRPKRKRYQAPKSEFPATIPLQMRPKGGTDDDWFHVLTTSKEECDLEISVWREQNPEWEFRLVEAAGAETAVQD